MPVFVIRAVNDQGETHFWSTDDQSGYPYWGSFSTADQFDSFEKATEIIELENLGTRVQMSDGKMHLNRMLHSGIGLCNRRVRGYVTISILQVELLEVWKNQYVAELP